MSAEQKYEVAVFELIPISKVGSGFVREDTEDLPEDKKIRILHPKNRVIMNTSVIRMESEKTPGTFVNVPIRYIYGQEEILRHLQEEAKMTTSLRDKIVFINGNLTVPNDGAFVGLFKFMRSHAQNSTNPDRVQAVKEIVFREVKAEKVAQDKNVYDLQLAEAMGFLREMVKEKAGKYEYSEEKIFATAANFGVSAETPAQAWQQLVAYAKLKPGTFLELAKNGEQTVSIEIKHALKLNLIKFEAKGAFYTEGDNPKIKGFSPAQNTEEKKAASLGAYFLKQEGKEAYDLFKEKLEAAKVAVA